MRDGRDDLETRRQALIDLMLPLAMRAKWDYANPAHHHDMKEWIIGCSQLAAIKSALSSPPDEDDEPGGETNDGS